MTDAAVPGWDDGRPPRIGWSKEPPPQPAELLDSTGVKHPQHPVAR
jgi:hypothetical protein